MPSQKQGRRGFCIPRRPTCLSVSVRESPCRPRPAGDKPDKPDGPDRHDAPPAHSSLNSHLCRRPDGRRLRQFDPAFIPAVADRVGGIVDELGNVLEHPASSLRIVVIDEGLPSDDLHPPPPPEILARDAALFLKIDEFEHGMTSFLKVHGFFPETILFLNIEACWRKLYLQKRLS